MTSVLMIFEMTQDYAVIVSLMNPNLVSVFVSSRLQRQRIYEALAVQDGIHLPTAETQVGELVDGINFPHTHPDQGVDLALERMGANQIDVLPIVNRANVHKLEGIVTLR